MDNICFLVFKPVIYFHEAAPYSPFKILKDFKYSSSRIFKDRLFLTNFDLLSLGPWLPGPDQKRPDDGPDRAITDRRSGHPCLGPSTLMHLNHFHSATYVLDRPVKHFWTVHFNASDYFLDRPV